MESKKTDDAYGATACEVTLTRSVRTPGCSTVGSWWSATQPFCPSHRWGSLSSRECPSHVLLETLARVPE